MCAITVEAAMHLVSGCVILHISLEIFDIILRINAQGKTVLLVEQNALAALSIAHYAYVLEVGRVVAEAPGKELLSDPKVKEAYLGG